jgi:hypothetical protein
VEGCYGGVCDCVTCLARYWPFPLFWLNVWISQCLWYSWRLSIVTAIRSGPCSILGCSPIFTFRAVLSIVHQFPVIPYLYSFDFRMIPGYLRFYGAGVRGERSIVDRKVQGRKSHTTTLKTNLSWASQGFNMDRNGSQSHDQSLSLDQATIVSLLQVGAKVSIVTWLTTLYLSMCYYWSFLYLDNKKERNVL